MKYIVLIIDGAAGFPIADRGGKTSLELARTPNLDALAAGGALGLARTVPPGMEPSSACACMSVMGYDPTVYYKGRASIEAKSLGIEVAPGEAVFRCNLVTVKDGKMFDYSAGHVTSEEAAPIVASLNQNLGGPDVQFYQGVGYRHILKIKGHEEVLQAKCTPPHDIPGKPVKDYLPQGPGAGLLLDLMSRSEILLKSHKINEKRVSRGNTPVTTIWLFWGTGVVPVMPPFKQAYGLSAALTSGVDLLRGLAMMADMAILNIKGVTDAPDSDHAAQARGALEALKKHDLVVVHIEAPDEAAHGGSVEEKIKAIEDIDRDVIAQLRNYGRDLRVLVMPDHPTPVAIRTHTPDPVPFLLWGKGVSPNGAARFTEAAAKATGVFIGDGYKIMSKLIGD
ncbi:MAG: cofactor-independent phosphoglycerate mutase [Dehalococcoidales bacterium]|nr:cofactor-independent phosphoglycerate mutase [Dehalococcoidales bacterium]